MANHTSHPAFSTVQQLRNSFPQQSSLWLTKTPRPIQSIHMYVCILKEIDGESHQSFSVNCAMQQVWNSSSSINPLTLKHHALYSLSIWIYTQRNGRRIIAEACSVNSIVQQLRNSPSSIQLLTHSNTTPSTLQSIYMYALRNKEANHTRIIQR